jgi:hypothetical protein
MWLSHNVVAGGAYVTPDSSNCGSRIFKKTKGIAKRDLPAWNCTIIMGGGPFAGNLQVTNQGTGNSANPVHNAIQQSLQVLLQQAQIQDTVPNNSTRHIKKPSDQWEGTIDLPYG